MLNSKLESRNVLCLAWKIERELYNFLVHTHRTIGRNVDVSKVFPINILKIWRQEDVLHFWNLENQVILERYTILKPSDRKKDLATLSRR